MPRLVFRGISAFGDQFKNDDFHRFAASMAAVSAVDFIEQGLNLPEGSGCGSAKTTSTWIRRTGRQDHSDVGAAGTAEVRRPLVSEVIASVGDVGWVW